MLDTITKDYQEKFPKIFIGLSKVEGEFEIKLRKDSKPFACSIPRKVPFPLIPQVKAELDGMEKLGVVAKANEPTEWCSNVMVEPKTNNTARICLDPSKLNENINRATYHLPHVDQILAKISGSKIFTKLDCDSGFWQIPLSKRSALLTSFITLCLFRKYYYTVHIFFIRTLGSSFSLPFLIFPYIFSLRFFLFKFLFSFSNFLSIVVSRHNINMLN